MAEQSTSTSSSMKVARLVINKLDETVENFQSQASYILSLSEQWRMLQSSFAMFEASSTSRTKELEEKEREISNVVREVELKQKNLEFEEKSVCERLKEVEKREKVVTESYEVMEMEKMKIEENRMEVEVKEKEVMERCRLLDEREKEIVEKNRVKQLNDHSEGFEVRERRIEERERELKMKEKEVNEGFLAFRDALESKKDELISSRRALTLQEKKLMKECATMELKAGELLEERKVLDSKEKVVNESCRRMELMKKEVDDRFCEVELREKELSEGFRALESKEKQISESCNNLELMKKEVEEVLCKVELKKKELSDGFRALKSKEKQINGSCNKLDLMKEVGDRCLVVEQKEKEIDERFRELEKQEKLIIDSHKGLELIEKEVDERFRAVELKEREMIDGIRALDLERKESHKGLELIENELDERFRAVELKEKEMNEGFEAMELSKKELIEGRKRLELKEKQVDEYLKIVELGEKQMNDSVEALDMRVKQLEDCCQGIELKHCRAAELREKELIESLEALEMKAKEIEECCKVMELKEKQMNEYIGELDLREQRLNEHCRTQEVKEKQVNDQYQALELKEKQIDERCQSMEVKEKRIKESCMTVELKEKQLNEGLLALDLKVKQIDTESREMELKKMEIDDRYEAMEVKEKQIKRRQRVLDLREQIISETCLAGEPEDKLTTENFTSANSIEKQTNPSTGVVELKEKQLSSPSTAEAKATLNSNLVDLDYENGTHIRQLCLTKNGKALQMFLNERVNEHESMRVGISNALKLSKDPSELVLAAVDGFFLPLLNNNGLACEAITIRKSCVLLLELVMDIKPSISEAVRKEAVKLANEWRDKMRVEGESDIVVLGFLLLLVTYDLCSIFEQKELQRFYKLVDQHRVAPQLCLGLGILNTTNENSTSVQAESGECLSENLPVESAVASSSTSLSDDIQFLCSNMDSKGVRSYLIQHVKEYGNGVMEEKMFESLRLASDPAKLVLDVIQSFYELKLEEVPVGDFTSTCMFLLVVLVQLMKLRADISSHVKDEAKNFADIWRFLLKQGNTPLENFGFLQFLASYKLAESYDADELLSLFVTFFDECEIYQPEKNPYLCDALGLTRKIPDLIQSLIMSDKQLLAVRYIRTLKMEDAFPIVPLLEAHLANIQRRVEEVLKNGNRTAEDDAVSAELSDLKAVVKYISDFKLESIYSPVSLENRIKILEKKRKVRKRSAHSITLTSCSNLEHMGSKEMAKNSNTPALRSDAESDKKHPANFIKPPNEEKRPRIDAHQTHNHSLVPGQPAPVWPYGYRLQQHQILPIASWPGYHFGTSRTMYAIPYNRSTGEFGVPGIYPAGSLASTYNAARRQDHRTEPYSNSVTVQTHGYRR